MMKRLLAFLAVLFCVASDGATLITPSDYLISLPKYPMNTNTALPRLTSFGYYTYVPLYGEYLSVWKELADEFSYAIPLGFYADDFTVHNAITPGSLNYSLLLLVSNNPSFYKLNAVMDRTYTNPPTGFYVTNAAGQFTDGSNVWTGASSFVAPMSFEAPSNYIAALAQYWVSELLLLTNVCPITYVMHGGEDGISYPFRFSPTTGAGKVVLDAQRKDPRVQAATNAYPSGGSLLGTWLGQYYNDRTSNNLSILNRVMTNAFPSLKGWTYFTTGSEQFKGQVGATWQAADARYALSYATVPYFMTPGLWTYYEPVNNNFFTNHANNTFAYSGPTAALFDEYLNGMVALNQLGKSNSFTWFTAGFSDSSLSALGDIDIQAGLMKCETVAGSISFCMGGFDTFGLNCSGTVLTNQYQAFDPTCPPHWVLQLAQAGYVKNFFSHYDYYLTNGVLLSDHNSIMLQSSPALWLTNTAAITNVYVPCRHVSNNLWMAVAWDASGKTNAVTVNIPGGPTVNLTAIGRGNTYIISTNLTMKIDQYVPYYAGAGVWLTNAYEWDGWISQDGTPDGRTNSIAWFNTAPVTFTNVYFTGDFTDFAELNESGTPSDNIILDMTRARWIKDVWTNGAFRSPGHGDFQLIGGLFAATNNGSGRGNTNVCIGMDLINTFRAVFNGCTVTGMFVRLPGSREFSPSTLVGDTIAMRFTLYQADITISNCFLSDAEVLLNFKDWGIAQINSNFHIKSNILFRSCISISFASTFTPSDPRHFRDFYVQNNVFDHQTPWSAPPENSSYGLHINYIFPFTADNSGNFDAYGTTISNIVVNGNYFGPDVCGTNFNTSLAIQSQWGTTNMIVDGFRVFNNVFVWTNTICHSLWNNAFVTLTGDTNLIVANNDFITTPAVDCDTGLLSGRNTVNIMESYPVWFVNNFTRNCHLQNYFNGGGTQTNFVKDTWSDYNVFALPWTLYTAGNLGQYDFFGPFPGFPVNGIGFSWTMWTNQNFSVGSSFAQFDRHSTTNNPAVNADYTPQTNSILLLAGTNLTAYGFNNDYLGVTRPASGNWTIGAFELPSPTDTNPAACFTGSPTSGSAALLVVFTDCSTNANTWSWDFGDSGTSTAQNPTHSYNAPGVYTVSQTVGGFGLFDTLVRTNYITVTQPPSTGTNAFKPKNRM